MLNAGIPARGAESAPPVNIAVGRSYVLSVAPNYPGCTDAGDGVQLTDGSRSPEEEGPGFWQQPGTVGWQHARQPIEITVDLGEVQSIGGAAFYTGAGVSGVSYPRSVAVMASDDGQAFHLVGDLVRLTEAPLPPGYGVSSRYGYRTTSLHARGRFVRFVVVPTSVFLFCDEIEVYSGNPAPLDRPLPREPVDVASLVDPDRLTQLGAYTRIRSDLESVRGQIASVAKVPQLGQELTIELDAIASALNASDQVVKADGFRAIVPFNDLHRRTFAVYGRILAARGVDSLAVWHSEPYEMLGLFEAPRGDLEGLRIKAMRNERRAEVVNLTNASAQPQEVQLAFEKTRDDLHVYEVQYVDSREGRTVHSAMRPVRPDATGIYRNTIPAGMTRQFWIAFQPNPSAEVGTQANALNLRAHGASQTIPLELTVAPIRFPDQATLNFNGFDYIFGKKYSITDANQAAAREFLQRSWVNTVWCSSQSVPYPDSEDFDSDGNLIGKIDFSAWEQFVAYFPNMRHYMAFASLAQDEAPFAGKAFGTPAFDRALSQWAAAWAAHNREMGLKPGQVLVLFCDEPKKPGSLETSAHYGKAFGAGTDDILLFTDPAVATVLTEPGRRNVEAYDVICPHLPAFVSAGKDAQNYFRDRLNHGQHLWFYSCSGPVLHFDPGYYRYQPWYGFHNGATGSGFWAFGDSGGASSWNPYAAVGRMAYTPWYIGETTIDGSKHWEAALEGVQDYEYLHMLAALQVRLRQNGTEPSLLDRTSAMLDQVPATVLESVQKRRETHPHGSAPLEDRSMFAEQGRLKVLSLLEEAAKLGLLVEDPK